MRSPRGMGAVEPLHPTARACCACLQRQGQALPGAPSGAALTPRARLLFAREHQGARACS